MTGMANISAYSGWSQALLGALLVFCGLVLLVLAIAQVKKFVALIERRRSRAAAEPTTTPTALGAKATPDHCPTDIGAVARHYQPLVAQLPSPFPILQLYELAHRAEFPHPYISVKCLREAGVLEPHGDGFFSWKA